ncbi:hypothetical protein M011DRAFT_440176 [Sporormia fimetaria CBS 119925]|uniref:Sensor histidine kinase-like protein/response regulator n=1 Tax=Sporormia fimetaria CBS 119925 TaxID=1340428 RepID=A0A6A6VG77_9PLEO|nr:hypothetical protein M011DRAFT_440176 [Sporormia fimetaria CBS 119925]
MNPAVLAEGPYAHREMEQSEKTKEREFYRYYHHSQRSHSDGPGTFATQTHTPNADPRPQGYASAIESPVPSDDKALTAFAQLGALRLKARRGLISFFDRKNCYILAEATPTLSLQTGEALVDYDRLQWGRCVFPKHQSICYYTVNLHADPDIPPHDIYNQIPSLVVNDLTQDERFKHYPSVTGPARVRFYAGVPIRSPRGHNIGTFCVLDDLPREGTFAEADMLFLKDMAHTIMRHLEMTRAADDHRRGGIMVRSLGSFAEGKSSLEDWSHDPWGVEAAAAGVHVEDMPLPVQRRRRRARSSIDARDEELRETIVMNHPESHGSTSPSILSQSLTTPEDMQSGSAAITPGSDFLFDAQTPCAVPTKTASATSDDKGKLSPEVKTLFGRACRMIREAVEADGAVFFNAQVSTFGGMVDDEFVQDQQPDIVEQDKPCVILGEATMAKLSSAFDRQNPLHEGVLRHLLRSYPHGQIFNFDDDTTPKKTAKPSMSEISGMLNERLEISSSTKRPDTARSQDDENLLKEAFPDARTLVLYPLWDSRRDRWYAGAIIWSSDPMRVFTNEQELSYLAAFSNNIMSEVARLDIKLADTAKGDFISSISHELRSPLHGILGCCELLKESEINSFQSNMAQTIETCGKTLLDTINHVLDFAKINSLTKGTTKRQSRRSQSTRHMISPAQSHANDIMTLVADVDLSVLSEEVLETVFAGYSFQKSATSQLYGSSPTKPETSPLAVIMDVDKSENYVFRTQPGAWRRVLMNLFGNALKYTPSGYVKVKLEVVPSSEPDDDSAELRLTVVDSGIGMSEEYINNRLFHSFAQENPLTQGTGLGLSIVKQIIESLGGDIEVRSQKNHGTRFTVSCRLKPSTLTPPDSPSSSERDFIAIRKRTKGMTVAFVGFDAQGDYFPAKSIKTKNAAILTMKALENLCTGWFGMKVQKHTGHGAPPADLYIATESGASWLRKHDQNQPGTTPSTPTIVLCQGASSAHSTNTKPDTGRTFECIPQPCGPHKLAKALSACLDRHETRTLNHSIDKDSALFERRTTLDPSSVGSIKAFSKTLRSTLSDTTRPALTPAISAPVLSATTSPVKLPRPLTPRPLNCLATDDNPINLRLLQTFIGKLHHKYALATNGVEAVNAFKAAASSTHAHDRFDVILMDINMPEMDGLEATRQIRAYERDMGLTPVTIIALTGVASSEAQQDAHVSGVNLFLIKPVRLGELETVLNGVVIADEKKSGGGEEKKSRNDGPATADASAKAGHLKGWTT